MALAIGYYLHLCQDIEAHNYWIPKLTAESGLAELSIFEPKDIGQYYEIVPGGQTHSAIEVLHDYRLGLTKCQDVATTLHTDFWYCAGSTGIPVQILDGVIITGQFEPPAGPVFYPASSNGQPELYEGLNPALHFFYKVLEDWHQNNPLGLNYEHTSGPLISLLGFIEECQDWLSNHVSPPGGFWGVLYDLGNLFTVEALDAFFRAKVKNAAVPEIEQGISAAVQTFMGIMVNDPVLAEQLALDPTTPINYQEFLRLRVNPLFTDPNYFNGFTYFEDLSILYFDQIGPGGLLYSDWTPEYYHAYHWGVLNSLNGYSTYYEQRSDIGVFDAFFTVNGARYGPGVQVVSFQGNSFTAVAELYAFENMPGPIQITAKVKLDHNSSIPANDYTVKTASVQMQQNPQDYNTTPRTRIEISFSGDDMQSVNLQDYRGAYIELLEGGNAFYSTDWKQYAGLSQVQGNRRYEEYDTYRRSPYSYPQNYLSFSFTNMTDDYQNIGGTVNVNGQDKNSGEAISFFFDENVTSIAEEIINYNSADYKHHNWQENYANFYRAQNFIASNSPIWDYHLHFKVPGNVNIDCQGGDVLQLEIHDPWYVDANGNQPNDFRLISEVAPTGVHKAFRDQLIDPNRPYYSFRAPQFQDIYLSQSGRTHRFHFRGWQALPASSADFQNVEALQTPVVFRSPNALVRANYKGTQVGTNYQSNGQKKFLNCLGKLFSVYEDANTIWLESSANNGLTWNLRNNAQPLVPVGAQCPSLSTDGTTLLITYQENASTIKVISYDDYDHEIVEVASLSVSNPEEARLYPSSDFRGGAILTGWERAGMVECRIGRNWVATYPHIGATYSDYVWPLMESNGSGLSLAVANDQSFHLAVSKRTASDRSTIIYKKVRINWDFWGYGDPNDPDNWGLDYLIDFNVSKGGSYPMNIEPSISNVGGYDPIISWTAGVWTGQQLSYTVASVRAGSQGGQSWGTIQTYSQYPNEIIWTVNNSVYSQQQTVIIWSAGSPPVSKWVARSGASYSSPQSLSHNGAQIHICPGSSIQNMYAMVFNRPVFTQASTDFSQELPPDSPLAKPGAKADLSYGRSGVIYKDSLEFIFHFGDVLVEDSVIGFIRIPDTSVFSSTSQLNQCLKSEDFPLQPNSSFHLRTRYEVLNRQAVHSALTDSDRIAFKIELMDALNNTVVSLIDSVTYHKRNLKKQKKNDFQINCSAISPGRYYLRMNLAVTGDAEFTLVNHTQVESPVLAGKHTGQTTRELITAVNSYNLYQNYPNPFNPATTIAFSFPEDVAVNLQIYDITGRKVRALADHFFPAGVHRLIWDGRNDSGSQVSSGIYIYRIQAGNYSATRKMVLLR